MEDLTKNCILTNNPGYWINAKSMVFSEIDEHANWITKKENAQILNLDSGVYDKIKDLYSKSNRAKIAMMVMDVGLIRCRRYDEVVSFEFTIPFNEAVSVITEFLNVIEIAGEASYIKMANIKDIENPKIVRLPFLDFMNSYPN